MQAIQYAAHALAIVRVTVTDWIPIAGIQVQTELLKPSRVALASVDLNPNFIGLNLELQDPLDATQGAFFTAFGLGTPIGDLPIVPFGPPLVHVSPTRKQIIIPINSPGPPGPIPAPPVVAYVSFFCLLNEP